MIKVKDFDFNEWQANPSLRIFTDEGCEVFNLKYYPSYAHLDQLHGITHYGVQLREMSWNKDGKIIEWKYNDNKLNSTLHYLKIEDKS